MTDASFAYFAWPVRLCCKKYQSARLDVLGARHYFRIRPTISLQLQDVAILSQHNGHQFAPPICLTAGYDCIFWRCIRSYLDHCPTVEISPSKSPLCIIEDISLKTLLLPRRPTIWEPLSREALLHGLFQRKFTIIQ